MDENSDCQLSMQEIDYLHEIANLAIKRSHFMKGQTKAFVNFIAFQLSTEAKTVEARKFLENILNMETCVSSHGFIEIVRTDKSNLFH